MNGSEQLDNQSLERTKTGKSKLLKLKQHLETFFKKTSNVK